ncbi:hypothetical protein [Methylobacterium sp. NFXW15]|uniref:DUF7201 family protein n=1 Tax=Methylobacterium sp. NFXW15 TaxID=2819512 RepID=UPI003CEC21AE
MATFVPRSEIEKDNKALSERIDAAEKRLDTMEKRVWEAVAGAVSAFGSVVLSKIGLMHGPSASHPTSHPHGRPWLRPERSFRVSGVPPRFRAMESAATQSTRFRPSRPSPSHTCPRNLRSKARPT